MEYPIDNYNVNVNIELYLLKNNIANHLQFLISCIAFYRAIGEQWLYETHEVAWPAPAGEPQEIKTHRRHPIARQPDYSIARIDFLMLHDDLAMPQLNQMQYLVLVLPK